MAGRRERQRKEGASSGGSRWAGAGAGQVDGCPLWRLEGDPAAQAPALLFTASFKPSPA